MPTLLPQIPLFGLAEGMKDVRGKWVYYGTELGI